MGTPPPKSDETHFVIKLVVLCLGALTGPRENILPPLLPQKLTKLFILVFFCQPFGAGTLSFMFGGPYGPRGVLSDFGGGGGVLIVYNRTDPGVIRDDCCTEMFRAMEIQKYDQQTYQPTNGLKWVGAKNFS